MDVNLSEALKILPFFCNSDKVWICSKLNKKKYISMNICVSNWVDIMVFLYENLQSLQRSNILIEGLLSEGIDLRGKSINLIIVNTSFKASTLENMIKGNDNIVIILNNHIELKTKLFTDITGKYPITKSNKIFLYTGNRIGKIFYR